MTGVDTASILPDTVPMRPTRAIIHTDNFRHNIRTARRLGGGRPICAAVKADAYGHGAVSLSRVAIEEGVDLLAVATVDEGGELREAGIDAPILLLGHTTGEEADRIVQLGLQTMVGDEPYATALDAAAARRSTVVDVHLKVDTGMGRIGCRPDDAVDLARRVSEAAHLRLAGVATHLPVADGDDRIPTEAQLSRFTAVVDAIGNAGIDPVCVHAANSAALLSGGYPLFDLVRPGIMLYGYAPSPELTGATDLRPVMELRSQIVFIKRVPPGTGVSYGLTWRAPRETVIGTVAAGYADGYNRLLSNTGTVAIGGALYPVVGRVCMDQFMVDLGPAPTVGLYDEVVLFGPDPPAPDAQALAGILETIPYEITCRIDQRVPRVYQT